MYKLLHPSGRKARWLIRALVLLAAIAAAVFMLRTLITLGETYEPFIYNLM